MGDYYDLLGVDREASPEEIRDAYFEVVRLAHPDTNPQPDANESFLKLQEAYEVLRDPKKRRAYDRHLPAPDNPEPLLKITATYSKSKLARIDEPQLLYALVKSSHLIDTLGKSSKERNLVLTMIISQAPLCQP